jgi:hypothetical protein
MAGLPQIGTLLNGGYQNGLLVYTQPGGVGSPVFPQPPTTSPPGNWKRTFYKPSYPFVFSSLLTWGCGHWTNTCEVFEQWDPVNECQAALLCCPVCSFLGYIVEPYADWFYFWYSIYPTGLKNPGAFPTPNLT